MGIKFKNVSYKESIKKINLDLVANQVVAIIGEDEGVKDIFDLIYGFKLPCDGEISVNRNIINADVNEKKLVKIRNNVAYLTENDNDMLFNINVLEDIKYGINKLNDKKLYEFLEMFNLDEKILSKDYMEISSSEKRKINIISVLLKDSKVTLLSNLSDSLDTKSKQNLVKYLRKEKRNNKLYIVSSTNADFLLQVADSVIVVNNKNSSVTDAIKFESDKYSVFEDTKVMNNIGMDMAWVIKFKNRVREMKNIKLNHRDNVNDLLKDIYRNATKVNK